MLFHEPAFLFVFLPLTLVLYFLLRRTAQQEVVVVMLGAASLLFYSWWDSRHTALIVGSIIFNFLCGRQLRMGKLTALGSQFLLVVGVVANLALLFAFKYLAFAIDSINLILPGLLEARALDLPLGVSFFTFLQIAYLIDCYRGKTHENKFAPYFLFVTFFPHLIAGPLIHHSEMISQFKRRSPDVWQDLAVGLTVFSIGLFKKLVLSQQVGLWADAVFDGAAVGITPSLLEAWIGALCFSFQIYFDFSGYSDMAVGLSRMFGIRMPINFASPYKAINIIDFWRRWHMTLSRFFREYLYIPLGGNRIGLIRQFLIVMLVMLLAGLWHGADWKFVLWGALHGMFLIICHGWKSLQHRLGANRLISPTWAGVGLTFLVVVVAWVPFRADSIATASVLFASLFGLNGFTLPLHYAQSLDGLLGRASEFGVTFGATTTYAGGWQLIWIATCLAFVWFLPNTQEFMRFYRPALVILGQDYRVSSLPRWCAWRPTWTFGTIWGLVAGYLFFLAIQGKSGEFIYFRF